MLQTIKVRVSECVDTFLQIFSGKRSTTEKLLLDLGAPVYRVVPNTKDNLVVSTRGIVLKRKCTRAGQRDYYEFVKPCYNKSGYLQVNVPYETKRVTVPVHRLVALTFLPKPRKNQTDVDHIDGNKENNTLANLRWTSHQTNCSNPVSRIRKPALRFKPIRAVDKITGDTRTFTSIAEAYRCLGKGTKGWSTAVARCVKEVGGYAYGYYWYRDL